MQKLKWRSASSPKNNKYILVTGANGYIGSALCRKLLLDKFLVKGVVRCQKSFLNFPQEFIPVQIGAIGCDTQWDAVLEDVDTVIHLAGIAHKIKIVDRNNFADFHSVNVLGTECLAKASALAGVRRFIFLSSIGVNGEFSDKKPFTEDDIPDPIGAYSVSKWEAEQVLHRVAENTGMEVVILRPPLVYGLGVKANFNSLIKLASSGLPLPFKGINNRRSFIYLGNLVDAIGVCVEHPKAAGETFLVSDGRDVSTPDLIKMIAYAMNSGKSDSHKERDSHFCSHLFYLPLGILKMLCKIVGKSEELEKLTGTLLVDSSKISNLLGWKAPFTLEEGIRETVRGIEK